MKNLTNKLLLVVLGFMMMGALQLLTRCNSDNDDLLDGGINPDELKVNVDYNGIKALAGYIEEAFLDANQTSLDSLTSKESLTIYKGKIVPYTSKEMETIGKALKSRELTLASEMYAEYSYKIENKTFTLAIGRNEKGVWKIIRY